MAWVGIGCRCRAIGCLWASILWLGTTTVGWAATEAASKPEAVVEGFDIWEYRVEGNTLLDARAIEAAISPHLGPGRNIEEVNEAAAKLERAYRDAGFPTIYVDVPEQDVVGGVVTLVVVEGRLDRVRVEGARYFTLNGIRAQLPSLTSGQTLHVPTMQKELTALNAASPDLSVVPVLKPGRTPGSVDLDLKVEDRLPLHGSVELNNYNSVNTTDTRASLSLSYDNLWQRKHSFALQWQTSPERGSEVDVLVGTYIAPWFETDNRIAFYVIESNSSVASLGDINVIGDGRIYGARFVMPLASDRHLVQSLSAGFDFKDYNEVIRLDVENRIDTPIDYGVWSLQYNAVSFSDKARTQWTLSANVGVRGLGNDDDEFIDKRYQARSNFVYLRGSVSRTDYLPADWQLLSTLRLQLADSPLINNEQFSVGGVRSVRGYYESQALGDHGLNLGLELRTPRLLSEVKALDDLRLTLFVEGARMQIEEPLPDQERTTDLAGAGVGLVLQAWSSVDVALDWAQALKDNGSVDSGDNRFNAGLTWKF